VAPKPVSIETLDPELREAFVDDAASCLAAIEQALLRMESDPASGADALIQIGRQLHTLKGASASVGLSALADRLHQIEETLQDDQKALRQPEITLLLSQVDAIRCEIGLGPADGGATSAPEDRTSQAGRARRRIGGLGRRYRQPRLTTPWTTMNRCASGRLSSTG
jgi:chemotaxis protein histidine kinase CheA